MTIAIRGRVAFAAAAMLAAGAANGQESSKTIAEVDERGVQRVGFKEAFPDQFHNTET